MIVEETLRQNYYEMWVLRGVSNLHIYLNEYVTIVWKLSQLYLYISFQ